MYIDKYMYMYIYVHIYMYIYIAKDMILIDEIQLVF